MTIKKLMMSALAALGLVIVAATAAAAQDDPGRAEYLNACAACHGSDGQGAGEVAQYLTVEVPDLTRLAANNDGVFPLLEVIHVIDGRSGVRGHGTEFPVWGTGLRMTDRGDRGSDDEMPVWGDVFRAHIGEFAGPFGAETIVRGRVLNLALYLESIQR